MCEIDEQHELRMRARDEMRKLTDEEICKYEDAWRESRWGNPQNFPYPLNQI